ncbi:outer membrane protein transport protein [Dyella sp.]|uniref:outer membrane protein transport protein n=1 Tax=Dyella sp. TaxID=1869338 RepID=UPI002ED4C8D9
MKKSNNAVFPHAKTLMSTALAAALLMAFGLPQEAHAAAFQLPVTNAAGYGRAFAGGSLWQNDPSAAYNNPAAMAWLSGPVMQGSWIGIDISAQYHGATTDAYGRDIPGNTPNAGHRVINDGSAFYAMPVSDRFAIGFGIDVPYGLLTKYDSQWRGAQWGTMTSLKSFGVSMSGSFKVSDTFSLGFGVIAQRTRAQLNNGIDVGSAAGLALQSPLPSLPQNVAQINVRVHNWSQGYFLGAEFKPSDADSLGISYHSRVGNRLKGQYRMYYPNDGKTVDQGGFPVTVDVKDLISLIPILNQLNAANPELQLPELNPNGGPASAVLDLPAFVNIDYLHRFSDRFSMGASAVWTNWSKFQTLTLVSDGTQLVSLPQEYKNSWTLSLGGDYQINDQWTLRGGFAWDQTPTTDTTRDPRVPDNDRKIVSIGVGYKPTEHFTIDAAYSHQFLSDPRINNTAPLALGGGNMNGSFSDSGNVASITATYQF